jgi:hypothetical protein
MQHWLKREIYRLTEKVESPKTDPGMYSPSTFDSGAIAI